MQKVTDFLEKHVQWLAVGLGALFLGYMAYTFLLGSPVQVQANNETVGPGRIEEIIVEGPVAVLETKLRPVDPPPFPTIDWYEQFKCAMEFCRTQAFAMGPKPWVPHIPIRLVPRDGAPGPGEVPGGDIARKVEKLPTIPAPTLVAVTAGSSTVNPNSVAKTWTIVTYNIPCDQISEAFKAVQLPNFLYPQTAILEVKVYRQEQKSDLSWSPEVLVKRLANEQIQATPADNVPNEQKKAFLEWAAKNQPAILQPVFYEVVNGDTPVPGSSEPAPEVAPGEAVAAPGQPGAGLPEFDANKDYSPEEIKLMTPQQKQAYFKAQQEKRRKEQQDKGRGRPGRPGGKGGGAAGGGGGLRAIDDPDRPDFDFEDDDEVIDPFRTNFQDPGREEERGQGAGTGAGAPAGQPGANGAKADGADAAASAFPCPTGFFDPRESPNFTGWFYDETVEQGKVYRYRVEYTVKNPLFNNPNVGKDPKMADQFGLVGKDQNVWTKEVKVPSRTSFYLAANFIKDAPEVRMQVFVRQGGGNQTQTFSVAPGDVIGRSENGIDFTTGSTLVDIVHDDRTNKGYILVADPNGDIRRKDYPSDANSAEFQADRAAVGAAPSASAAPPPTGG